MAACPGRRSRSKAPEGALKRSLDPPEEVVPPKRKLPWPQRKRKRKSRPPPQGSRPPAPPLKKPPNEGKGSKDSGGSSAIKTSSLFRNNPQIPEIQRIPVQQVQEKVFTSDSFDRLGLHPHLVSTITSVLKLSTLTSIQKQAIPVLLQGRDALVRSQTGSGKTLAYGIPLVQSLQGLEPKIQRSHGPYALILVPTRELALQSLETIQKLLKPFTWIVPGVLMGGEKKKSEKARLRKGLNVLVATPGRLLDHLRSTQCLHFGRLKWLVLDEADRMLDLGFEKAVATLLTALNAQGSSRQNVLLSATLTQGVSRLSSISLRDAACLSAQEVDVAEGGRVSPAEGLLSGGFALPEGLRQEAVVVPLKLRLVTLAAFLLGKGQFERGQKVLVFFSSCEQVDFHCGLFRKVLAPERSSPAAPGLRFLPLHGDMPQQERTSVFQDFLRSESGVLLCTDVAARGLDLPRVTWIVQYSPASSLEGHIHRVGRTGRLGGRGHGLLFLCPSETPFLRFLASHHIPVSEVKMESILSILMKDDRFKGSQWGNKRPQGPDPQEWRRRATAMQTAFETLVHSSADSVRQAKTDKMARDTSCSGTTS
ncbi:probable ATP-dependent RNA helicase DDX31 isoform X2 [Anolis carolinensis]|uniref:probable ATP-dependent RNA helicase DDX31 isoform X2 n=1 Tax=Anolis carolinensis TaxID=28377 RepID=UPI002F2B70E1